MVRKVVVLAHREDGEADQSADEKCPRVGQPAAIAVAVLHNLPEDHEERERREQRHQPEKQIVEGRHVAGEERSVSIPPYVREEIRRHHFQRTDAEVIIFHNHPRLGTEPDWFYTLKSLLQDLPIASTADRNQLQHHALNSVAFLRQLFDQGRVLFYLGESGFMKEFKLPHLLLFLERINAMNSQPKGRP